MKTRRCSLCKKKVDERQAIYGSLRAFCSMEHLIGYSKTEKGQKIYKQEIKKETAARKNRLLTRRDYLRRAQIAFNAYIRARDHDKKCISCDADLGAIPSFIGFDCGHYRSIGSATNLRFHAHNAFGQCKKCNRYLSGNAVEYRKRLVARIGLDKVERLEMDDYPRRYSTDDLQRIVRLANLRKKRYESR